ncbi:MAG TPA: hypothetical protein VNW92_26965, partial [Polyangiaceae bacterium]|nr:hypothetical protein [Polyangiaceae bacterium]
ANADHVMILVDHSNPPCASRVITRVLVDHGYAAWPTDPPDVPGHVMAILEQDHVPEGRRFSLTFFDRHALTVLATATRVVPAAANIDYLLPYLDEHDAEQLVAEVVTTPTFREFARHVHDNTVDTFRIDRPDTRDCQGLGSRRDAG